MTSTTPPPDAVMALDLEGETVVYAAWHHLSAVPFLLISWYPYGLDRSPDTIIRLHLASIEHGDDLSEAALIVCPTSVVSDRWMDRRPAAVAWYGLRQMWLDGPLGWWPPRCPRGYRDDLEVAIVNDAGLEFLLGPRPAPFTRSAEGAVTTGGPQ